MPENLTWSSRTEALVSSSTIGSDFGPHALQTTAHWGRQRAHEAPSRARLASQVSRPPAQLLPAFPRPRAEIHAAGFKLKNSFCSESPVFPRLHCLRVLPALFAAHLTALCGFTLTPGGRNMNYRRASTPKDTLNTTLNNETLKVNGNAT